MSNGGCRIITTPDDWRGQPLPILEGESPLIAPGTPLAVIGLFMAAIRYRFTDPGNGEPLPWYWDIELTPESECVEPVDNRQKLLVEAGFNVDSSSRNYRPAIYVDRNGDVIATKVVIDNRAGQDLPSTEKAYFALAEFPLLIECDSETPAESAILADTVWFFLLATRDVYRENFGLYNISEPTLGPTRHAEYDKEVWQTTIQFTVQIELRWGTRPIAPLLRDIAAKIQDSGNPDVYYHQIALREFR